MTTVVVLGLVYTYINQNMSTNTARKKYVVDHTFIEHILELSHGYVKTVYSNEYSSYGMQQALTGITMMVPRNNTDDFSVKYEVRRIFSTDLFFILS